MDKRVELGWQSPSTSLTRDNNTSQNTTQSLENEPWKKAQKYLKSLGIDYEKSTNWNRRTELKLYSGKREIGSQFLKPLELLWIIKNKNSFVYLTIPVVKVSALLHKQKPFVIYHVA